MRKLKSMSILLHKLLIFLTNLIDLKEYCLFQSDGLRK